MNNDLTLFTNNYNEVLKAISPSHSYSQSHSELRVASDKLTFEIHLDKWDIISGIILAGAITALVVGVSLATYYIIVALCNAGILAFASGFITTKMKEKFSNFIKTDLGWVFEQKLTHLTEEKIKEMHSKIKEFLIKHFDGDAEKISDYVI